MDGTRRAKCQRPQGKQIPPSADAPTIAYGPSPCRAFARVVVDRADELGDTPSANRALCIVPTAARHAPAAEAHPFVRPGSGVLAELADEWLCGFVGRVIKAWRFVSRLDDTVRRSHVE